MALPGVSKESQRPSAGLLGSCGLSKHAGQVAHPVSVSRSSEGPLSSMWAACFFILQMQPLASPAAGATLARAVWPPWCG